MWFRWRHGFSYGTQPWSWSFFPNGTKDDVLDFIEREAELYNHSDKYRGISYDIIKKPPKWVVTKKLAEAERHDDELAWKYEQDLALNAKRRKQLAKLLTTATACEQCGDEDLAPRDIRGELCPLCGRRVMTIPKLLLPSQKNELKLLKSLVEKGDRFSKKGSANLLKGKENAAYQELIDRGLAGGEFSSSGARVSATQKGIWEWKKHAADS